MPGPWEDVSMRKVLPLVFILISFMIAAIPTFTQQTVTCTATAPAHGTTGVAVQFQGTAIANGGNWGMLWATDLIVGKLYRVHAGIFTQGTPADEVGHQSKEGPQFQHTLTKNIAVMETEVSRQMWDNLRSTQPSLPAYPSYFSSGNSLPVERVNWYQTILFANLLSLQNGLQRVYYKDSSFRIPVTSSNFQFGTIYADWNANGYRLPTEGEWEYFARAGTTGPFSITASAYNSSTYIICTSGVLPALESVAWFCANSESTSHPVGSKASNPWGLKDVHGNVWEWCWDWWGGGYPSSSQTDYRGPSNGSHRVVRGGSWSSDPEYVRSGSRYYNNPGVPGDYGLGFRLLRSVN